MPRKKIPCPVCGKPMAASSKTCRFCSQPYERTQDHRQAMSDLLSGVPKPALKGRKRPNHSMMMKNWWTEERREKKRQEMLRRNPHDQRFDNLLVLCHRCHMQCHAKAKETGWDVYHQKRKSIPN